MLLAAELTAQLALLCSRKANHSFRIPNDSVVSAVAFGVSLPFFRCATVGG